jgi:hypothetical protein
MASIKWYRKGPLDVGVDQQSGDLKARFNRSHWSDKRKVLVSKDERGLPVVCWRDAGSWLPRATFIFWEGAPEAGEPDKPREAKLVHVRGDYKRRGRREAWLFGTLVVILSFFLSAALWINYWAHADIKPFEKISGVIFSPILILFAACCGMLGPILAHWTTTSAVWRGEKVEIEWSDWEQLGSFDITDTDAYYGALTAVEYLDTHHGMGQQRRVRVKRMIAAYFDDGFAIDISRSKIEELRTEQLHRILTREFILNRQGHFDRLASAPVAAALQSMPPKTSSSPVRSFADRLPHRVPDE